VSKWYQKSHASTCCVHSLVFVRTVIHDAFAGLDGSNCHGRGRKFGSAELPAPASFRHPLFGRWWWCFIGFHCLFCFCSILFLLCHFHLNACGNRGRITSRSCREFDVISLTRTLISSTLWLCFATRQLGFFLGTAGILQLCNAARHNVVITYVW